MLIAAGPQGPEAGERHTPHAPAPEIDRERHEMQLAAQLSQQSPQIALLNPIIANAFSHYVEVVAPWYDLTDSHSTFGAVVAMRALDFPVLFRAIIALACCNLSVISNQSEEFGFAFHAACVEDLITAVGSCPTFADEYLAAACLLQLYEILDCKVLTSIEILTCLCMMLSNRPCWSSRQDRKLPRSSPRRIFLTQRNQH